MNCLLCDSNSVSHIFDGTRGGNFKVYKCGDCGVQFIYPQPSEKELKKYYENEYRKKFSEEESVKKSYGSTIGEYYANSMNTAIMRLRFLDSLSIFEPRLSKSILEIGCSTGAFLIQTLLSCYKTEGVEPISEYREFINSFFSIKLYEDIEEVKEKYDIICAFWVLEHIKNPIEFMNKIKDTLLPNGRIILEVPNNNDALLSFYNIPEFKKHYYQLPHLWYFGKDSIDYIFSKIGLNYKIYPVQRYGLANHLSWFIDRIPTGNDNRYSDVCGIPNIYYCNKLKEKNETDNYIIIANT